MKVCNRCKEKKKLSEFNKNKKSKDNLQRTCRNCTKEQHDIWYKDNKETQILKNKKVRANKKEKYDELKKSFVCSKCKDDRWYVLDFHHIDPSNKLGEISILVNFSMKKVYDELKKCVPLCKNCHAEFHHLERQFNITTEEYLSLHNSKG